MTAATTITSTDATRPFSRPLSSISSAAQAQAQAIRTLSSGPASSTLSSLTSVPVSWAPPPESVRTVVPRAQLEREGRCDPVGQDADNPDASGARLIIPAISLRSALSKPTRTGRVSCLREVPSFAPPPGLDRCPESTQSPDSQPFEPTPISSPTPAPLSATVPARGLDGRTQGGRRVLPAESTVPMRRPWRIGKATAAACGVGGLLVVLGLVASTTDAAESIAARIQLALHSDAIPAAAADPAPHFAPLAPPAAPAAAPELTTTDEVIELETATTAPKRAAAPRAVKRTVARPVVRAAAPTPIRLRSPY